MGDFVIWVNHPFGNANVRAVLRALHARGMLERFYTSMAFPSDSGWMRALPHSISEEMRRRSFPLPGGKVFQTRNREILRQIFIRAGLGKWTNTLKSPVGIDAVWRSVDHSAAFDLGEARKKPRAIYAYEDGALLSFRKAKELGIKCIYDQPIGYFESARKIFEEDRERLPEFACMLEGIKDTQEKLDRKKEEAALADVIVSCSDFVTRTLVDGGIDRAKIREVQFGVPAGISPKVWSVRDTKGPLKVLFVGRVSQRKGIGYLLRALQQLEGRNVECHILGPVSGDPKALRPYRHLFHYHSPAPQDKLFELMRNSHTLVMPSLFEGQALVILEAMRIGLPVVVTPNTGAEKIVRDGEEGFIVQVGSSVEIQRKIEWMLENRSLIPGMGEAAYNRVKGMSWNDYEESIVHAAQEAA